MIFVTLSSLLFFINIILSYRCLEGKGMTRILPGSSSPPEANFRHILEVMPTKGLRKTIVTKIECKAKKIIHESCEETMSKMMKNNCKKTKTRSIKFFTRNSGIIIPPSLPLPLLFMNEWEFLWISCLKAIEKQSYELFKTKGVWQTVSQTDRNLWFIQDITSIPATGFHSSLSMTRFLSSLILPKSYLLKPYEKPNFLWNE